MEEYVIKRDLEFEKKLREYMDEHLPEKVFNAHFHITRISMDLASELPQDGIIDYVEPENEADTPFGQYLSFYESQIGPNKLGGGMMLPLPGMCKVKAFIDDENQYNLKVAEKYGQAAGLLVTPESDPNESEDMLAKYSQIRALKPYMTYTSNPNRYESDILEFAPEWIWALAHEHEFPVILHIAHNGNQLSDPKNIEQIRYISEKYPKCKIVLAHCGMGYNSLKNKMGLEAIKDLKNIWFDCSGAPETVSMFNCMKYFGWDHMMWGDDYSYGTALGRMRGVGANYLGLCEGEMDYSQIWDDYRFIPMTNAYEGIMSLFEACDMLGLGQNEIDSVFYKNAAEFYKI